MSSHREAPEISKDPVADNADVYAFVSPDKPDTVTIISNFVPLQGPAGGPNFYEFGDDVLYSIYIDNDGDAKPDIEYQFQFKLDPAEPEHVPLQHGPDRRRSTSPNWNTRQFYSVTRIDSGKGPKHGTATAAPTPVPAWARASSSRPCSARTCRARRATSGRARRRTTTSLAGRGDPDAPAAARRSSPASGTTRSTSTWGRSSTSATCGRSNTAHLIPLADGDRRRRDEGAEHPLDRDPGPDLDADHGRLEARPTSLSPKAVLGIWSAASRRKARDVRHDRTTRRPSRARGSRSRGSATRCSTR